MSYSYIVRAFNQFAASSSVERQSYANLEIDAIIDLARVEAKKTSFLFNAKFVRVMNAFENSGIGAPIAIVLKEIGRNNYIKHLNEHKKYFNVLHNCALAMQVDRKWRPIDGPHAPVTFYQASAVEAWRAIKDHPVGVDALRSVDSSVYDDKDGAHAMARAWAKEEAAREQEDFVRLRQNVSAAAKSSNVARGAPYSLF